MTETVCSRSSLGHEGYCQDFLSFPELIIWIDIVDWFLQLFVQLLLFAVIGRSGRDAEAAAAKDVNPSVQV